MERNPLEDYDKLIEVLDNKFKFKDRVKFEKELLDLISGVKVNSANDTNFFADKFFSLIKDNSSEPELEQNIPKAKSEIREISGMIKKWQSKNQ